MRTQLSRSRAKDKANATTYCIPEELKEEEEKEAAAEELV